MIRIPIVFGILLLAAHGLQARLVQSERSGLWNDAATWQNGNIPAWNDSVLINAGHIISVAVSNAACGDINFAASTSQLAFTSSSATLYINGNFTLLNATHKAIQQFAAGARIVFTGSRSVQLLQGWNSSDYGTCLPAIVVDKSAGKLSTAGNGMRLILGGPCEVIRGTFELALNDDIETRDLNNLPVRANFIIRSAGKFVVAGGQSYIRRSSSGIADSTRTGTITVAGVLSLATLSASRLNFSGVTIEQGGSMILASDWISSGLNAGVTTVQAGGTLLYRAGANLWYAGSQILLLPGGAFISEAVNTAIPLGSQLQGTVSYALNGSQLLSSAAARYAGLILSGSGEKKFSVPVLVTDSLVIAGNASLNANGYTITYSDSAALVYAGDNTAQTATAAEWPLQAAQQKTIIRNPYGVRYIYNRIYKGVLDLQAGMFQNQSATVTFGNGAVLKRSNGKLEKTIPFSDSCTVEYNNTDSAITTGVEISAADTIQHLVVSGLFPVHLTSDIFINGSCRIERSRLFTGSNIIHFTPSAAALLETDSSDIEGRAVLNGVKLSKLNTSFLGMAIPETADTSVMSIERITGEAVEVGTNTGIAVIWKISLSNGIPYEVHLQWNALRNNGKQFSTNNPPELWRSTNNGISWEKQNTIISRTGDYGISFTGLQSGWYTISDKMHPLTGEVFTMQVHAIPEGRWDGIVVKCDTLMGELHAAVPPYQLLAVSKQFCSTEGLAGFRFYNMQNAASYYLVVKHRNAVEVWSSQPVQFSGNSCTYDFTNSQQAAYGGNTKLKSGKYCLYTGDVDGSNTIDSTDLRLIADDATVYAGGQRSTDLNGDNLVDITDLIICDNNAYSGIMVRKPQ